MSNVTEQYSADNIQVLEGLEAVRRRPGMYIGSTDIRGLHHLVTEVVDNSIDEALAGFCTHIEITIHKDNSISVQDDGRGIPVGHHEQTGKNALEVALTMLHAGGKFGGGGYKVSGGLHGVGLSCVNALSKELKVTVKRENSVFEQTYQRGIPDGDVVRTGESTPEQSGTLVWFLPDDEIFDAVDFHFDTLATRLRELAFLNRGITITIEDMRPENPLLKSFYYEGGIVSFVQYLDKNKDVLHEEPMYFAATRDEEGAETASVEVAMQYHDGYNENVFTFANNINTMEGGSHLTGFRAALTRVVNDYAKKTNALKPADPALSGEDIREGLTAILIVKLMEQQF